MQAHPEGKWAYHHRFISRRRQPWNSWRSGGHKGNWTYDSWEQAHHLGNWQLCFDWCTVQWMNMLNEDLQKMILERVSFVKKEVEDEQGRRRRKKKKKKKWRRSLKYLQLLRSAFPCRQTVQMRHLNLEAASTASSHQREEAKEEKSINDDDDTAPPLKKNYNPGMVWSRHFRKWRGFNSQRIVQMFFWWLPFNLCRFFPT